MEKRGRGVCYNLGFLYKKIFAAFLIIAIAFIVPSDAIAAQVMGRVVLSSDEYVRFQKTTGSCPAVPPITYLNSRDMRVIASGIEAEWGCNDEPYYKATVPDGLNSITLTPPEGFECEWWDSSIWGGRSGFDYVRGEGCTAVVKVYGLDSRHTWFRVRPKTVSTTCKDDDSDGSQSCCVDAGCSGRTGDCDDNNPNLNPSSVNKYCNCFDGDGLGPTAETCDWVDNDCDGIVDNNYDPDGDGYTLCGGDCDETIGASHPGADEDCGPADFDCDGDPYGGVDPDICQNTCEDSKKGYIAEGFFQFTNRDGTLKVAQSLVSYNGQRSFGRICPLDGSRKFGIDWQKCEPWYTIDHTGGPENPSTSQYSGYCSHNFQGTDTNPYIAQKLINTDGRKSWKRNCPLADPQYNPATFSWSPPQTGQTTAYILRVNKEQDVWAPEPCNDANAICNGFGGSGDFVVDVSAKEHTAALEPGKTYSWSVQAVHSGETYDPSKRRTRGGSFSCSASGVKTENAVLSPSITEIPSTLNVECIAKNSNIVNAKLSWAYVTNARTQITYIVRVNKEQDVWAPAECSDSQVCGDQYSGDFIATTASTSFKAYISPSSNYGWSVQATPTGTTYDSLKRRSYGGSFSCSSSGDKTEASPPVRPNQDSPSSLGTSCMKEPYNGIRWESCTPWTFHDLKDDSIGQQNQRFPSCDEYDFYDGSGSRYLVRSFIDSAGNTGSVQKCPMISSNNEGIKWEECGAFETLELTTPEPSDPRFTSIASYKFTDRSGNLFLVQKLRHMDQQRSWNRKCPMNSNFPLGVNFAGCGAWELADDVSESGNPLDSRVTIDVRAKGTQAEGWPVMQLWTKDSTWQKQGEWTVQSPQYKTFLATVPSFKPGQKVAVVFTNDYNAGPGSDRNLYIDYVNLNGTKIYGDDKKRVLIDHGSGPDAFDNIDLAEANNELEQNGAMIFHDTTLRTNEWVQETKLCCGDDTGELVKYDPETCSTGCCGPSQCFDSSAGCINSGSLSGNKYCENGDWVNRKSLGKRTLSELGYDSVSCGTYQEILNSYSYPIRSIIAERYLEVECRKGDGPCINDLCAMASEGRIAISGSFNRDPSETELKEMLNYDKGCTHGLDPASTAIRPCSQGVNDRLWYDRKTRMFIYSSVPITLSPQKWRENLMNKDEFDLEKSFSSKKVIGNITAKCGEKPKMAIAYNTDANICEKTGQIQDGSCARDGQVYRVATEKKNEENRLFRLWKELTAKLRIR